MRRQFAGLLLAAMFVASAAADGVKAEHVWVRATPPGQKVAGAFMELTSDAPVSLVGGESPAADHVELHTMAMKDGVMIMRRVPEIKLPKGQTVQLKPGGLHVMLIGIKAQLKEGETVPITLRTRDDQGRAGSLQVSAQVRSQAGKPEQEHHHH